MPQNYFTAYEFRCRCNCGLSNLDPAMWDILNKAREKLGRAIIINSGSRCEKYNLAIGGAKHSAHLVGPDGFTHAVDIQIYSDITRAVVHKILYDLGIRRFETSNKHLHADNAVYLPSPILASVTFCGVIET